MQKQKNYNKPLTTYNTIKKNTNLGKFDIKEPEIEVLDDSKN